MQKPCAREAIPDHQAEPHKTQEDDAQSARQYVSLSRFSIDVALAMYQIENEDQDEVKNTASQDIPDRQVRTSCERDRADPGDQFGQRRDGRQKDQANPVPPEPGPLRDQIRIIGEMVAGKANDSGQHPELKPYASGRHAAALRAPGPAKESAGPSFMRVPV